MPVTVTFQASPGPVVNSAPIAYKRPWPDNLLRPSDTDSSNIHSEKLNDQLEIGAKAAPFLISDFKYKVIRHTDI